jgi:hypothetical protein
MAVLVPAAIGALSTIGAGIASAGTAASAAAVGAADIASGAAFGAATGAATTAASTAATASLGLGAISTGLQTVGALTTGIGGYQQYALQSATAKANAAVAGQQGQNALIAGQNAESQQRLRTGDLVGHEKAAEAANGFDVGAGTSAGIRQATAMQGESDALAIRYNAAQQAYGLHVQQINDQQQQRSFGAAAFGSLAGGAFNAGASFIGGASSLAGKALSYYQSGAING